MKKSALVGITITAFLLASCGGSSNTIPSNIVLAGNLQTSIGNSTYVVGTEEWAAFNAINSFRGSLGLGYWQQDVFLDQSAQAHMAYSIANTAQVSMPFQNDIEVQDYNGLPTVGFSGITPSARAIAKGYYFLENTVTEKNVPSAAVGELYGAGSALSNSGQDFLNSIVNTIYHRSGLMAQSTVQVGLARDTSGAATANTHWWINHGRLTSSQSVASDFIAVYPNDQKTGIPLSMTPESPSVYSNIPNFNFATSTSSPVSFTMSTLIKITPISFTVTPANCSTPPCTPLTGTTWTMANDPNLNTTDYSSATINLTTPPPAAPTIAANEVYWVGSQPFQPNTTYIATFTGTTYLIPYAVTNGITKTWSFTTGS